jgi:hypothetical protein
MRSNRTECGSSKSFAKVAMYSSRVSNEPFPVTTTNPGSRLAANPVTSLAAIALFEAARKPRIDSSSRVACATHEIETPQSKNAIAKNFIPTVYRSTNVHCPFHAVILRKAQNLCICLCLCSFYSVILNVVKDPVFRRCICRCSFYPSSRSERVEWRRILPQSTKPPSQSPNKSLAPAYPS